MTTLTQLAQAAMQARTTARADMQQAGILDASDKDLNPATPPTQAQLQVINKDLQAADAATITFFKGLRSVDKNWQTNDVGYQSEFSVYQKDSTNLNGPFLWDDNTQRQANVWYAQTAYADLAAAQFLYSDATV